jgi:hypothetical protein
VNVNVRSRDSLTYPLAPGPGIRDLRGTIEKSMLSLRLLGNPTTSAGLVVCYSVSVSVSVSVLQESHAAAQASTKPVHQHVVRHPSECPPHARIFHLCALFPGHSPLA